ncbi:DUF1648 domain-containing protein [Streptacidiphilus griseoplanus]|uniref:DUF1648 domain-containing protein n=1 Tax=Peterkaempfera griseoplana TaxID=66896 RepID=UPI0006E1ADB2|nr:DUF1648 domain-containing protein [Peterkaempfera griseoplana]
MTAQSLSAGLTVLFVGAVLCVMPAFTRPTLQFGVRVPPGRTGSEVIRRERRAYHWRTGVLALCFTVAAVLLTAGPAWLVALVATAEIAAGFGCFQLARERITAAKTAEGWYEGTRQTITTDTTWRTEPERFPLLWAAPAVAVTVATLVVGIVRYPSLPGRLAVHFAATGTVDRWADKSLWSAFSMVVGQVFVTAVITVMLLLTYRSRPDIDSADAAGSTARYRRFLAVTARGLLLLAALINVGLLLGALQAWQAYRLTGAAAALPALPVAIGTVALLVVLLRMGQGGYRLRGAAPEAGAGSATGVPRDDDRFWKAGVLYVNRNDPAVVVGKRFGIGWTLNFGNPWAWLLLCAIVAVAAGLSAARGGS